MHSAFFRITVLWVLTGLLTGCSTLDLVSKHQGPAPVCEIHKTAMTPELIQLTPGELAYVQAIYSAPLKSQFPHHGDWVYQGERSYFSGLMFSRKVRDFVCPDCTAAFRRYWKLESS
jgi:hypothetical protein